MSVTRILMNRAGRAGVLMFLLGVCVPLYAQRTYTVGTSVDIVGGLDSYPNSGAPAAEAPMDPFYGILPNITLDSRTARTTISASYGFGYNRFQTELPRETKTHSASLTLSRQLNPRWNFLLSESFNQSDDLFTYYALLGVEVLDESMVIYFSPVATNQALGTNRVRTSFNHDLSARSTLSFGGEHSFTYYGNDDSLVGLSDQQTVSGDVNYIRRLNDRTSLNVSYNGSYYTFDKFNSAISNTIQVGLSSVLAKETTLSLSVGPSQVRNIEADVNNMNYQASASLAKKIKGNSFHVTLSQGNSTSSGVGTISNTRSASLGISRTFGRRVSLFGDASAFQGSGIVGNPFNTKGTSITGNVGIAIARNLSIQTGAHFQRYTQPSPYAFTQKRVFATLRYSVPTLFRSH